MNKPRESHFLGLLFTFLSVVAGCAGGGVQSGGPNEFSSDALVQAIPYEVLRSNLITIFSLTASSPAIELLDDARLSFGAVSSPGAPRKLELTLPRLRTQAQICDLAVREGMTKIPEKFFDPASPLDPSLAYRRIMGRPITSKDREAISEIGALPGYPSQVAAQHAMAFACCNAIKAQIQ